MGGCVEGGARRREEAWVGGRAKRDFPTRLIVAEKVELGMDQGEE